MTDQATAARIAGQLFSLPREQRMSTLIQLPVADRIAFTTYVNGDQKNLLLSQFNPREREIFNGMAANIGSNYQIVNELSQAKVLREIGCIERTVFTLDWITDPPLRRRSNGLVEMTAAVSVQP